MAKKKDLLNKLAELQAENHQLKAANEDYRRTLMGIYVDVRRVLGIEAAAAEREKLRLAEKEGKGDGN